ncbi:HNH endonuclease [Oscillatoria acuminata]|uniref:HNH endonuclease n=1 Tax=Oscillatoria acuminata PCC 6304 TaxID=56110 RepID=K9THG0_9CYAN|nr:HNH endonuclease [Oscillatoria acuminata]AFY81818.1 HNH endonuclease [Oscillatoria acuminata PCC 6304]
MPICLNCQKPFPNRVKIDNEWKVLNSRKFCLKCSPYKLHNTSKVPPIAEKKDQRQCSVCRQLKPLTDFYKRSSKSKKDLRKYECKKCHNLKTKERLQYLKQKAVELKGGKCFFCGYSKCIAALDFHHLDPKKKEFKISGKFVSFDKIAAELNKCILLCSNCHRELHAGVINLNEHKICLCCGKLLSNTTQSTYCSQKCYNLASRKVKRPSQEELKNLVWEKPTSQIAKEFGVSDKLFSI